jgi:hypothetical protein
MSFLQINPNTNPQPNNLTFFDQLLYNFHHYSLNSLNNTTNENSLQENKLTTTSSAFSKVLNNNGPIDIRPIDIVSGTLYIIIGLIGTITISFVIITLIKQIGEKKGLYSLLKSNVWYELAILLHLLKTGVGKIIDITNPLVCKVDSGFTFFCINMACFYYMLLMCLMLYNKGHYPQINKYKRYLLVVPAILIGLISVILLFQYNLSGKSPWGSCYVSKEASLSLIILFIPQFVFLILSLVFFIFVYLRTFSLTGIMKHFNIFCLFTSIFYIFLCISYYLQSEILGIISICFISISIIVFRMTCDLVVYSFDKGLSSNKFIHFLATLLCIDSPPSESIALDMEKEEKVVFSNIQKEKEIKEKELQKERLRLHKLSEKKNIKNSARLNSESKLLDRNDENQSPTASEKKNSESNIN